MTYWISSLAHKEARPQKCMNEFGKTAFAEVLYNLMRETDIHHKMSDFHTVQIFLITDIDWFGDVFWISSIIDIQV